MIQLRPVLGGMHRQGFARLGNYFLHLEAAGRYRISDTDQDATLVEEAPNMWRISDDPIGTGAIVSSGGLFVISG